MDVLSPITVGDATAAGEPLTLGQFQAVVAASTDFADFQTRVAAL